MSTLLAQRSDSTHSSDWAFKQLFKLESECRSQTPAMQVKAIGQFPKLLDQFPFPTLVSSAFFKLGDLFRSSPNSMRYHIAQVFESSQHHLLQITHSEELLKRIISVLYSNDPIARVLALRLVGNASILFAKYPEAQHGVLLRYQSTHPLEIAAAVQTTELMLKYSPELLKIVWETVISKANDCQVSDPVRAQLIHSLQHAASNLQLSARLYDHCRTWVCNPGSTFIIRTAALGTWKAIIQPHNDLKLMDAANVAKSIPHGVDAIDKASVRLLAKWRHGGQSTVDISNSADLLTIKQKLNEYVEAQLGHPVAIADYSCIRLAMIALARVECAPGYTSIPRCWELAEAICGASLHVLRGDASRTTTTALDYIQNNSLETNMYDTDGASLQASVDHSCVLLQLARTLFQGASPTTPEGSVCQMYRAFVRSVMIAVNVASVFKDSNIRQAATNIVASAWCTVAQLRGPPYETGYTKKFLRVTWKWCRSVGTDSTLSESLSVLLDGQNQCVLHANMAILASERSISEQIAKEYMPNIGQFANSFDSPEVSQGQHSTSVIWKSIAAVLTYRMQLRHADSLEKSSAGNTLVAPEAVTKWSQYMLSLDASVQEYAVSFARMGPPAQLCPKIMSLLSSCGDWVALSSFCRAIQRGKLSSRLHEWVDALCMFADAESKPEHADIYEELTDRSLCAFRALNNQTGLQNRHQQFLIQLRKGVVSIIDGWKRACSIRSVRPSQRFAIQSLSDRTYSLMDQASYVSSSFVCMDKVTQGWLDTILSVLSSIARVLVSAKRNSDLGRPVDLETTCKEISSCIAQSDALNFVVGPSFFFRQVNPEIDIETRPDLEGNNATVVSSGSQFHFTIEGFIRLPVDKLPAAPRRVNVAAWLSRHAFNEESSLDLELCAQFSNTAWNANTGSASQVGNGHIFAMEDVDDGTAWNTIWNAATVFSAKIDTTYFECPCALAIPSLHSLFGHVDTNMSAHVHVICALVDSSDRVWYIGPHRSYPLMISTTEKS